MRLVEDLSRIALFSLLITTVGCSNEKSNRLITAKSAAQTDAPQGISLGMSDVLSDPSRIYFIDSLLYMKDNSNEKQMVICSPKSRSIVNEFIPKGKGPGELIGLFYITSAINSNIISAYDIVQKRVLQIDKDSIMSPFYYPTRRYNLSKYNNRISCIAAIDEKTFVSIGSFDSCRVICFTIGSDNTKAYGGSPDLIGGLLNPMINEAYTGVIKYNKHNNKSVIGCRYADQLEIIDMKAGEHQFIKGVDNFEPRFSIDNVGQRQVLAHNSDERYGYVDVALTDRYIIGLYSGLEKKDKQSNYGKSLRFFSWDGEYVLDLNMDHDAISFCVDEVNDLIYTISSCPEIYTYKVNIDI